jgi:hypothetical protein
MRRTVFAAAAFAALTASTAARGSVSTSPTSFADIARQCSARTDVSGFGSAVVDRTVVSRRERVKISVPCTIHLTRGAALDIEGSRLKTNKLIIVDDHPAGSGSSVRIAGATITGTANAGLLVQLRHAGDSISVDGAMLSYPLSVYLLTLNTNRSGAATAISVKSTTIESSGGASSGIHLISDGHGTFQNDRFSTTADGGSAVMYAATCTQWNVTGAVPKCSP